MPMQEVYTNYEEMKVTSNSGIFYIIIALINCCLEKENY